MEGGGGGGRPMLQNVKPHLLCNCSTKFFFLACIAGIIIMCIYSNGLVSYCFWGPADREGQIRTTVV